MEFTVTEDHLKLLKRMYVGWSNVEFGAPSIDPKRPYGNSDVVGDILEIVKGVSCVDDDEITEEEAEYAKKLHKDMKTALQILVRNQKIEPGRYITSREYSIDFIKAEDGS